MNKKHLLVAASALVVGLSLYGGNAYAGPDSGGESGGSNNAFLLANTAVAASVQAGEVEDNNASGTVGSNKTGAINGIGLTNVQQNNGANSELQSANTLGIILSSCGCSTNTADITANTALAVSAQFGSVEGNNSTGAATIKNHSTDTDQVSFSEKNGFSASDKDTHSWSSTPVGSTNNVGSVGGTGLMNISQNNGNNSLLQSSNTVAAIIHN